MKSAAIVLLRAYGVVAKHDLQQAELPSDKVILDNKLRMLFVCCSPLLPVDSALPLALKTVCGFGIRELASAFLMQPEAMKKRLQRARRVLQQAAFDAELTRDSMTGERLEAVRQIVYLMFNEGYFSSLDDQPIRDELCGEAIRLASLLVHDPRTSTRNSHALCSLMLFHAARHSQRRDAEGLPLRLADQDRSQWDSELIDIACTHFEQSVDGIAQGPSSALQLEAAIAREHCLAASFEQTCWHNITSLYQLLLKLKPWTEVKVAYGVAMSFVEGPMQGLKLFNKLAEDSNSLDCNFYSAVADCHLRNDDRHAARLSYIRAREVAQTAWQRRWLDTLIERC